MKTFTSQLLRPCSRRVPERTETSGVCCSEAAEASRVKCTHTDWPSLLMSWHAEGSKHPDTLHCISKMHVNNEQGYCQYSQLSNSRNMSAIHLFVYCEDSTHAQWVHGQSARRQAGRQTGHRIISFRSNAFYSPATDNPQITKICHKNLFFHFVVEL